MSRVLRTICVVCVTAFCLSINLKADEPESAVGPLMKLFQSGRLPADRQSTVVEMICNRGNANDLKIVFEKVVQADGFTPELRLKAMQWLVDAAVTRKTKPAGDLAGLKVLVVGADAAKSPALQAAAMKLASTWKDAAISPALQALATDPKTKPELQRAAIEGLVAIGDPQSKATLEKLSAPSNPIKVRMLATAGLTGVNLPASCASAAAILADSSPQDDPDELIAAILDRKGGAEEFAAAIGKVKLKPDVAKRSLRYMYSVGRSDQSLSDVLSTAAGIATGTPLPTAEEVARISADVASKGDAVRGEKIFRRKDLNCMKCHSVSRAGGQVGPDLSAVGGSSPVDYVVNSILNPNLAVKEQYVTRVFILNTGRVLTGVVVDRDDVRINMKDATGQIVRIPTADLDEEVEGRSLMPEGLTKFLTRDELLDLAKFISELGKPGPFAVQSGKVIQRWRVLRNAPSELTAEVPHLEHIRQFVLGSEPTSWEPAYAQVAGVLPLDELRTDNQPKVLILQGAINVSAPGKASVAVTSNQKFQTWFDAEAFDSKPQFDVELTPGSHTITVRVEISAITNPGIRVELKTPNDSSANFEVIGGQ